MNLRKKTAIAIPKLQAKVWHHIRLNFKDGLVSVFLDKERLGSFSESYLDQRQIGFRGGMRNVLIDNVVIRQHNSTKSIHDSFSNQKNIFLNTIPFSLIVLLINILMFILLRSMTKVRLQFIGFYIIMLNLVLIFISGLAFGFQYFHRIFLP